MRILVIGGTGHIGGFLVPALVEQGDDVIVISRGKTPAPSGSHWPQVEMRIAAYDRNDKAWQESVAQTRPEVVIDIMGNDVPNTYLAVKGTCEHYIACGSIWMFGKPGTVPTPEVTQSECEFEQYALRYGELLQTKTQTDADGIAFTAIMPPNICGPGKIPIDCIGGRSIEAHKAHQAGKPVTLPDGCNTLISPCDASDVAQGFVLAANNRDAAAGEIFNVGSDYAFTAPQLIAEYGRIYGAKIPIEYVDPREFYQKVLPDPVANCHFRNHMMPDTSKAREKLGYRPRYTPAQAMARAVDWMRGQKLI